MPKQDTQAEKARHLALEFSAGFGWFGTQFPHTTRTLHFYLLMVAAGSLTPSNYAFRLGQITGPVILLSAPLLWLLLWYARQRGTVLLFCGLVLAQSGLIAFVGFQFRAEDRLVREIEAEKAQREVTWATQMANFHLNRLFEMLTPGNEFHPEELPELLEKVRSAPVTDREQWDQMQAWASDAEKRLAAVNLRTARRSSVGDSRVQEPATRGFKR
jgi:hypothetical protein